MPGLVSSSGISFKVGSRHAQLEPAQDVSPIGHPRIGHRAHDHPLVFRRNGKEAVDELLGLGGIRSYRTGDKAEINAGVLRLLEGLRVEQHAHCSRNVAVVRLGPIIVDPLLDDTQRGARIDLRRLLRVRWLDQHQCGGNESSVTHVILLTRGAADARNANASVFYRRRG
jgi:hypothetical protein